MLMSKCAEVVRNISYSSTDAGAISVISFLVTGCPRSSHRTSGPMVRS